MITVHISLFWPGHGSKPNESYRMLVPQLPPVGSTLAVKESSGLHYYEVLSVTQTAVPEAAGKSDEVPYVLAEACVVEVAWADEHNEKVVAEASQHAVPYRTVKDFAYPEDSHR
jgi:hypothetical protein